MVKTMLTLSESIQSNVILSGLGVGIGVENYPNSEEVK